MQPESFRASDGGRKVRPGYTAHTHMSNNSTNGLEEVGQSEWEMGCTAERKASRGRKIMVKDCFLGPHRAVCFPWSPVVEKCGKRDRDFSYSVYQTRTSPRLPPRVASSSFVCFDICRGPVCCSACCRGFVFVTRRSKNAPTAHNTF